MFEVRLPNSSWKCQLIGIRLDPENMTLPILAKIKEADELDFFSSEGRIRRRRKRRRGNVISGLSCFMQISRFHSLKMQMSLMYTNAHTITTRLLSFFPSFYVIVWKQKIGQNEKYEYGWSMNWRHFKLTSISSTLYARVFRTNVVLAAFSTYM